MKTTFPYRFYSHKIKHLSHSGKLFYLKAKLSYLYSKNLECISILLFNIKCIMACEKLLKGIVNE